MRQLAHAEVVDDVQRHRRQVGEAFLACAVESRVGQLLDEDVRVAIALRDGGPSDGLL
jgi:hypothetical protein